MDFLNALKMLGEGFPIRRQTWAETIYITFGHEGELKFNNASHLAKLTYGDFIETDWEVYVNDEEFIG